MAKNVSKKMKHLNLLSNPIFFEDILISKFLNSLMIGGKKETAEKILYKAFDLIKKQTKKEPIKIFYKAIENAKPFIEVKSVRVAGNTYKVPIEINADRQQTLAIRWIIETLKERSEKTIVERLSNELLDLVKEQGITIKKRDDLHRLAEANTAFSHYRW